MKRRIAVMILGPLGDVINTTGIFERLRKVYPDAILSIITIKAGFYAIKGIKELDKYYVFDEPKGRKKTIETLKFGLSLRGKFDVVLVLDNSLRSALCAFMTGAKKRVGRGRELRELFLTDIMPYLDEERQDKIHVTEHFARCLRPLGAYEENIGTCFHFSYSDEKFITNLLKEQNLENENLIGFCPACHSDKKSLSIEQIVSIVIEINKQKNSKVVIVGGDDISELVSQLKNYENIEYYDFTGKTTFTQTAALIDKCQKFISVDTSCMHLAFARKVPTVAIFFTKLFKKWGPKDLENNSVYVNLLSKGIDTEDIMQKLSSLPQKNNVTNLPTR